MITTNKFNIKKVKETADYGKFIISPLIGGFGHTLGNTIRRILYITIPGSAITKIKIKGADHLFTTLPGVKEDLVQVSLNLKQVKFVYQSDEPAVLKISAKGPGKVTAKDIQLSPGIELANPDQFIATLVDTKSKLDIELTVESGYGYLSAKERESSTIGEIPLDADFSPVRKVSYLVEPARLGKKHNYDQLTLEITTDSSILPSEALELSIRDLIAALMQIIDPKEFKQELAADQEDNEEVPPGYLVEEIDLPLRVTNALKKAGFTHVTDLIKAGRPEVSKAKNVGEKSLKLIDHWLAERDLSWSA
jgi:DNA-directed RNA polymerase subunit alpha